MNQTSNYQLSQWESTDRILMSDFNSDNAKLDAALKAQSDAIAAKAAQSTVTALTQTVSTKASQADLNSLTQTVAGHTATLEGKGNCQIYYTTYTGNGKNNVTLTFPGKPLLVMVHGPLYILMGVYGSSTVRSQATGIGDNITAVWGENSLSWSFTKSSTAPAPEGMNQKNTQYYVVAVMAADE